MSIFKIPIEFFYSLREKYLKHELKLTSDEIRFLNEYYDSLEKSEYEEEVGAVMELITEYKSRSKNVIPVKITIDRLI